MLPLLRTILLLLWFRNFSEVYDFNLMTLCIRLTEEAIHEYRSRVSGPNDPNSEFSSESLDESFAKKSTESTNTYSSGDEDYSFLDDPDLPF